MNAIKNVFARNRRSVEVLVTLCIIALLIFYYYAMYVPQKERAIVAQRFRTMKNIDNKVKEKLRGYESLMHNYLVICSDTSLNFNAVEEFVGEKSSPHFSLKITRQPKVITDIPERAIMSASNINHGGSFLLKMDTIAACLNGNRYDSCKYVLTAEVSIADFLTPILRKDIFDEYIIINDTQRVYETFPSGLSYNSRDSLLQAKGGIVTGSHCDMKITGINYTLFMQPVKFRNYEDWIIIGLMKKETLNAEKHHLPGNVIEWLIISVLLFCFLLPWLKIMLMGKSERIKLEDVVFTYVCGMLLVSFIFFIAFKYNLPFRPSQPESKIYHSDSKIFIAKSIASNFQNEIEKVYNQVKVFDSLRYNSTELSKIESLKNIENEPTPGTNFGAKNSWYVPANFADSTIKNSVSYQHFINIYWIDSTGREVSNWSKKNINPTPPGNLSGRDYFKKIRKEETFSLKGNPYKKYFLEPLYSWNDREFKVALSIPSRDSGSVAVITFRPQSVIEPVMLLGYQYAIVNEKGTVLFHSNPERNLNENLQEELSAAQTINTSLHTRVATGFVTDYVGKKYAAYTTPLASLPYSIAVFSDWQFKERRNIECFSFSLMMFFTFFLILCLELVLILIASYHKTRLRKNKFNLGWMYPLESKKNAYSIIFCVYAGATLFLTGYIIFSKTASLILFIFIFLSGAVLLSILSSFIYSKLESFNNNKIGKHFFSRHFRVWLLALGVVVKRLFSNNASGWLISLWLIINCAAWYYLRIEYIACLIVQLVILIIAVLAISHQEKVWRIIGKLNYTHLFTAMIFMRLLITCGLPMVLFYINGYNYDQHVTTRLRLLEFARGIKAKSSEDDCLPVNSDTAYNCFSYYTDQSWVKGVQVIDTSLKSDKKYTRQEYSNLEIIHYARIGYNQLSQVGDDLSNLHSSDQSWHFNSVFAKADTLYLRLADSLQATARQPFLRLYSDHRLSYRFPVIFRYSDPKQVLFWILLFAVLIIFYRMLHFMVQRLYGLIASSPKGLNDMYRPILRDNKLNNLVFINGAPGSSKVELTKKELAKIGLECEPDFKSIGSIFIVDMIDIPDSTESATQQAEWDKHVDMVLHSKHQCVIFNHFEYNINDQNSNRNKLNMIERFMRQGTKKLIIVSTIHQSAFLDSLQAYTPKTEAEKNALAEDLPRWDVLLGHFVNLYVSLNQEIEEICLTRPKDWNFALTIWEECRHTNFLRKLHCPMQSFVAQRLDQDEASIDREDIILKVQSLAHLFYLYMWNSLLREEQFLLYDLAEDGLINTTNKTLIRRLMNKGLIHIKDGRLILFNQSFRNFILTSISSNDVKMIEEQIKDNGTWKTLRYPALLILAALCYFIFTAEQENLGEAMKYLSALAAGIPLIVRMLSFVMPADAK